jgi:hypothetical protein
VTDGLSSWLCVWCHRPGNSGDFCPGCGSPRSCSNPLVSLPEPAHVSSLRPRPHRSLTWLWVVVPVVVLMILGGVAVTLLFVSSLPRSISLADSKYAPLVEAIDAVDREALGFTPIESDARVRISKRDWWEDNYDVQLTITGRTVRHVVFVKSATGYRWIGEQEAHYGPRTWDDVDAGYEREYVCVTYNTQHTVFGGGVPLNEPYVTYHGPDYSGPFSSYELTLDEAAPVVKEWDSMDYLKHW